MSDQYKILRKDAEYGPYDRDMVVRMAQSGAILPTDLISKNCSAWFRSSELAKLLAEEPLTSSTQPNSESFYHVREPEHKPVIDSKPRIEKPSPAPLPQQSAGAVPPPHIPSVPFSQSDKNQPFRMKKSRGLGVIWFLCVFLLASVGLCSSFIYFNPKFLDWNKLLPIISKRDLKDQVIKAWVDTLGDLSAAGKSSQSAKGFTEAFRKKLVTIFSNESSLSVNHDDNDTSGLIIHNLRFINVHFGDTFIRLKSKEKGKLIEAIRMDVEPLSIEPPSEGLTDEKPFSKIGSLDPATPPPFAIEFELSLKSPVAIDNIASVFQLVALDKSKAVVLNGPMDCLSRIESGKITRVTGLLQLVRVETLRALSFISLGKVVDPDLAKFESELVAAFAKGDQSAARDLASAKRSEWDKRFLAICQKELDSPNYKTRLAVISAYMAHRVANPGESLLIGRMAEDKNPEVAYKAFEILPQMKEDSSQLIAKLFTASGNTTGDLRAKYLALIEKLPIGTANLLDLYLREASNNDPQIKAATGNLLSRWPGSSKKIQAIIPSLLGDSNTPVVLAGIKIMQAQPGSNREELLPKLLNLTGSKVPEIQTAADAALDHLKPFKTTDIPAIKTGLSSNEPKIRRKACLMAESLGKGTLDLVPSLTPLINSTEQEIRLSAMRAIGKSGAPTKDILPKLFDLAKSGSTSLRIEAISAIASIGRDNQVIGFLLDGLADKSPEISKACASALNQLSPPLGIIDSEALGERVTHPSAIVRKMVFETLVSLKDDAKNMVSQVEKGLTDTEGEIVLLAIKSLTLISSGTPASTKKIASILSSTCNTPSKSNITLACLAFLAMQNDGKAALAIEAIEKAIISAKDQSMLIACLDAAKATGKQGYSLIPLLLKIVSKPPDGQVVENLQNFMFSFMKAGINAKLNECLVVMGPQGANELGKGLYNSDPAVRLFCLTCLEKMGPDAKPAMPAIFRLTVAQNEKVPIILLYARNTYMILQKQIPSQ